MELRALRHRPASMASFGTSSTTSSATASTAGCRWACRRRSCACARKKPGGRMAWAASAIQRLSGMEVARDRARRHDAACGGPREDARREAFRMRAACSSSWMGRRRPARCSRSTLEEMMPIVRRCRSHSYLLHEFPGAPCNAPCYFKEFVERAGTHGLAYLADAEPSTMFVQNYGEKVREPLLRECGSSQVMIEQYLDFLVNRTFRQTLLVRSKRDHSTFIIGWTQRACASLAIMGCSSPRMAPDPTHDGFARTVPAHALRNLKVTAKLASAQGRRAGARRTISRHRGYRCLARSCRHAHRRAACIARWPGHGDAGRAGDHRRALRIRRAAFPPQPRCQSCRMRTTSSAVRPTCRWKPAARPMPAANGTKRCRCRCWSGACCPCWMDQNRMRISPSIWPARRGPSGFASSRMSRP